VNNNVKTLLTLALVGGAVFAAYKYFNKSYDPIEFLNQKFVHVEDVSPNEHVLTVFYTVDGVPIAEANEFIQITSLGPKVTRTQRDAVDRQIRMTMRVKPVAGRTDRLFGVMQKSAVYVYMMESTYIIYAVVMVGGTEDDYLARADKKFDAMEWISVEGL
jgi:hypothetical protein